MGAALSADVVTGEVKAAVVVDNGEADTLQPAAPARHVLADFRVGAEEYHRVEFDPKDVDGHFVTEGVETAVSRGKGLRYPCSTIRPRSSSATFRSKRQNAEPVSHSP